MLDQLKELLEYKEFLFQFTAQQLKTRYRNSVLGLFWTLLNPVLTCLALSIVFAYINRWDVRTTGLFFFAGYMPWLFFVNGTMAATFCIVGNTHYVNRIYVPRLIFPIATMLVNLTDLAAGMIVVLGYMVLVKVSFSLALATIPISILVMAVFVMGVSFLYAAVNVFLRDFQYLWLSVSFLWFFFTPILYHITALPPHVQRWFALNPLLPFIRLFQQPICDGAIPSLATFGLALLYSLTMLGVGLAAFSRSERSFYLYL
jgi:ABC-type polysaccharide/polyol phosphate export permease